MASLPIRCRRELSTAGPQPGGGQSGNCHPEIFKRMFTC